MNMTPWDHEPSPRGLSSIIINTIEGAGSDLLKTDTTQMRSHKISSDERKDKTCSITAFLFNRHQDHSAQSFRDDL